MKTLKREEIYALLVRLQQAVATIDEGLENLEPFGALVDECLNVFGEN